MLLRIAVVAVLALLVGTGRAEDCDNNATCQAFVVSHCQSVSCGLKLRRKCDRKGAWLACHTKGVRKIECETSCAPAIQADCRSDLKCRRQKLKGCMLVGPGTAPCSATTTTTTTSPLPTTAPRTTTTHGSTTTTTLLSQFTYGGVAVFVGSVISDSCGDVPDVATLGFVIDHDAGSSNISVIDSNGHSYGDYASAAQSGFAVTGHWSASPCYAVGTLSAQNVAGTVNMSARYSLFISCDHVNNCRAEYVGTLSYD